MANNQSTSSVKPRQSSMQGRGQGREEKKEEKAQYRAPALSEDSYVDSAERVIRTLAQKKDSRGRSTKIVTTSQIRLLIDMTQDIYQEVSASEKEKLDMDLVGRLEHLRVRFIYECGKSGEVKDLVETADLLPKLKSARNSRKDCMLFCRYMEALVAFRKYIGNDQ